jgi:hypothetical protein
MPALGSSRSASGGDLCSTRSRERADIAVFRVTVVTDDAGAQSISELSDPLGYADLRLETEDVLYLVERTARARLST